MPADDDPHGAWCPVAPESCAYRPYRSLTPSHLPWDYCTPSPIQTSAGCTCRPGHGFAGQPNHLGTDETGRLWCEVDAGCLAKTAGQTWDWVVDVSSLSSATTSQAPSEPIDIDTTANGCSCVPWTHLGREYPAQCFNPTADIGGPWCFVDSRTCTTPPFSPHSPEGAWDFCSSARATTASGCACKHKWSPFPGADPVSGTCLDTNGDGSDWCVVYPDSCADGEPAGVLSGGESWDLCEKGTPIDKISVEPASVTTAGCDCLDRLCTNTDDDSAGPWCIVDVRTCASVPFGAVTSAGSSPQYFDYCAEPQTTQAGCLCQAKYWLPPHDPAYEVLGECVSPDSADGSGWCIIDASTCRYGTPAGLVAVDVPGRGAGDGRVFGSAWDLCLPAA